MNLFILDQDVSLSAQYHVDKHVVKMPTETAQMISFLYHDKELWNDDIPEFIMQFSKAHYKHPCTIWIKSSIQNFNYACKLGLELYNEYQYRYNKPDKHQRAKAIFEFGLNNPPNLPNIGLTPFAEAMDDEHKISNCPITNYRQYYKIGKNNLHKWTNRPIPDFIQIAY